MIPGTFTLTFPLDANTLPSKEGDSVFEQQGSQLVLSDLNLMENDEEEGLLLGIVRYTALSGQVWIDRGEGVEALSGAELTLKDENGETVNTLTTGEDGGYLFGQLMPGSYTIEAVMPEGCVLIEPGDPALTGDRRSIIAHPANRLGVTDSIQVRMDQNQTGLDIGCVLPGRLGDLCWLDLNGDGYQGAGEGGIPNVRIELLRGEQLIAETTTDAYGFYRFVDLYPAAYTLRVYAPDEVKPTMRKTDIPMIVSVLEEADAAPFLTVPVQVISNRANYNADLGFTLRAPGVYPAGYGQGATQDWSPGNN
jgi:hypothetical protein